MSRRYCMPSKRMRVDDLVGALLRAIFTVSPSAVTHSTRPPLRDDACRPQRGAGVEHAAVVASASAGPSMRVALARRVRIAGGGHHHAERGAAVPLALRRWSSVPSSACSISSSRSLFRRIMIGCVSGSPRRQLNSSIFGLPSRVDHQAGVEEAGEGHAVRGHALHGRAG